jgi:hypothetical protein
MAGILDCGGFQNQPEAGIVTSVIVLAAAGEAGFASSEGANAGDFCAAGWAEVDQLAGDGFAAEGELVATGFVNQSKVGASLFPFRTVGGNAAAGVAGLSDEVGQFMSESAVDFGLADERERGVENDAAFGLRGEAGGRA